MKDERTNKLGSDWITTPVFGYITPRGRGLKWVWERGGGPGEILSLGEKCEGYARWLFSEAKVDELGLVVLRMDGIQVGFCCGLFLVGEMCGGWVIFQDMLGLAGVLLVEV